MVQIKPAEAERFLANPDPKVRLLLVYGPDDGLVAERVALFVRSVLGAADDPFGRVQLESNTVADDPGLLADEAHSVPLFGGHRVIVIRISGNRSIQPALEVILAAPPIDAWVVVAAGELRKSSPLRRLCESSKGAAAIACYSDGDRDLDRIIDEETRAAGLTIAADARNALKSFIGSDRLASRSEIRKLCLYAAGAGAIGIDDIRAIIGDASAFDVDEAIDALALGNVPAFDRGFRRLLASGTQGFVIAGAALRHFNFLHRARAAMEEGASPEALVARAVPPIFFKRQADVARQIALWSTGKIERALAHLDQAMVDSRLRGSISDEVIGQALALVSTAAPAGR